MADKVGACKCIMLMISWACSGFLYSVSTASKFIETGSYKKIIVVGTDKMSSIVDYSDRTTCIIFGDGSWSCFTRALYRRIWSSRRHIKSDGSGGEFLHLKKVVLKRPALIKQLIIVNIFVFQDGQTVFKAAVKNQWQMFQKKL